MPAAPGPFTADDLIAVASLLTDTHDGDADADAVVAAKATITREDAARAAQATNTTAMLRATRINALAESTDGVTPVTLDMPDAPAGYAWTATHELEASE
jgi:hypothetical protein